MYIPTVALKIVSIQASKPLSLYKVLLNTYKGSWKFVPTLLSSLLDGFTAFTQNVVGILEKQPAELSTF